MRRGNSLILNILVVVGLVLGTVPLELSVAASGQPPGTISTAPADGPALASKQGKRKRERRQDRRQHDRKADRKHDRKDKQRKQKQRKLKRRRHQERKPAYQAPELLTGVLPGAAAAAPPPDQPLSAENRYIVRLREGAGDEVRAVTTIASGLDGVVPTHVYRYVFSGFAAVIPPDKLEAVQADPRVAAVVPDRVVHIAAQTLPTGINRIDADQNPTAKIDGIDERVDVDVAVVDSAGNDSHPDLNIWAWGDCTPSRDDHSDDNGHGTHVGGTIGALDNGIGVVGVAPGARLWNIKVLSDGIGFDSWIICGMDLVTRYATDQGDGNGDLEVANVSLGGLGLDSDCATDLDDLFHQAFCRAVAAGVTVAAAAGNNSVTADVFTPAAYDEVIAVSALADSDGLPGGSGPTTSFGPDDTLAEFSNFGSDVDLAAPGVSILSTVPRGSCEFCRSTGYRFMSGTSMAAPHVAGAAALYLATHPGASPDQVKAALLAARETGHLEGDPDGIDEGVLDVGAGSGFGAATGRESRPASDAGAAQAAASTNDTGQRGTGREKSGSSPRHHHPRTGRSGRR
jgi:subtilisin family serine protease